MTRLHRSHPLYGDDDRAGLPAPPGSTESPANRETSRPDRNYTTSPDRYRGSHHPDSAPDVTRLDTLPLGTEHSDAYLILEVELRGGTSPHTLITLGNRGGKIQTAPFWPPLSDQVLGLKKGDAVLVTGQIGTWRDRKQLQVTSIAPIAPGKVDWRDLMPSIGEVTPWWVLLDDWRREVRGPRLRLTLALFYDDPNFRSRFEECPASLSGHHAELGGLLMHTCEVAAIGRRIAEVCGADTDLVLAGILLHDIGKIESYRWNGCFEMTNAGSLLGHIVLGALMLERKLEQEKTPPCSDEERLILQHLILSHHGKLEFGAPVLPMTLEAEVIHYADNASAKSRSMGDALNTPANFPETGNVSSRGIWQLDRRRIYRGTSDWGADPIG